MIRTSIMIVGAGCLLIACSYSNPSVDPTSGVQGRSGIEGTTVVNGFCPVATGPCPERPLAAVLALQDATGREILRFQSAADGHFKIDISPGTYQLTSPEPLSPPFAKAQTVIVVRGQYINVGNVPFDSGLR